MINFNINFTMHLEWRSWNSLSALDEVNVNMKKAEDEQKQQALANEKLHSKLANAKRLTDYLREQV